MTTDHKIRAMAALSTRQELEDEYHAVSVQVAAAQEKCGPLYRAWNAATTELHNLERAQTTLWRKLRILREADEIIGVEADEIIGVDEQRARQVTDGTENSFSNKVRT
jgi:hypothetical protein